MKSHSSVGGILILCDSRGVITRVVHDGLGLAWQLEAEQPFARAFELCEKAEPDPQAQVAKQFMETLCRSGYACGWQIPVLIRGELTPVRFTGSATEEGMLIAGNPVSQTAHPMDTCLIEELMRINNETVRSLRGAAKQALLSAHAQHQRDNELLAELSRANNDVMTAQRELAKKNAILTQTNATLEETRSSLEAKQAALEEANVRLDALATMDGLTGLKNRRAFGEKLREEVSRSARYKTPLSLILLDVDRFKHYNDTFGHLGGDEVLKTVARLLREQARANDFVARYGGEEFTLVLPNTDASGALVMAERLRMVIESAPWPQRAITASFGAATLSPETSTETELIGAADRALYACKEGGRNRVLHARALNNHQASCSP